MLFNVLECAMKWCLPDGMTPHLAEVIAVAAERTDGLAGIQHGEVLLLRIGSHDYRSFE